MAGTNAVRAAPVTEAAPPTPVATVCLHVAHAHRDRDDDGAPVLLVSDGDTTVELAPGLGGDGQSAALGARRVAHALLAYAATIEAAAISSAAAPAGSGGS